MAWGWRQGMWERRAGAAQLDRGAKEQSGRQGKGWRQGEGLRARKRRVAVVGDG